jgi:SAM-dependent methyltransferase
MAEPADRDWAASFSEVFAEPESAVEARAWAAVLGDEYPAELAPYSYTTRSELARIAREAAVGPDQLLVDVGAGRGGPGLWVAVATGASYLAVDIAAAGLAQVRDRAGRVDLANRVRTAEGSLENLPLPNAEAAAMMSIDALLFTPDKQAAIGELARVLRPGGRLVLTTWDYHRQSTGRPPQVPDHRPLLKAVGFQVLAYEETPDWERRQREIDRLLMGVGHRTSRRARPAGGERPPEPRRNGRHRRHHDSRVLIVAERRRRALAQLLIRHCTQGAEVSEGGIFAPSRRRPPPRGNWRWRSRCSPRRCGRPALGPGRPSRPGRDWCSARGAGFRCRFPPFARPGCCRSGRTADECPSRYRHTDAPVRCLPGPQ